MGNNDLQEDNKWKFIVELMAGVREELELKRERVANKFLANHYCESKVDIYNSIVKNIKDSDSFSIRDLARELMRLI